MGKSARRAYGFEDITIVPSRRTRDPEDIDLTWEIDAYRFDLPFMASAMDSVVSPASAIAIGRQGGVGVLHLEGLWTRYEDADAVLAEISELDDRASMLRMQQLYEKPVDPDLILERIAQVNAADVVSCAAISPQLAAEHIDVILKAELGLLVIQQPVISAEHLWRGGDPGRCRNRSGIDGSPGSRHRWSAGDGTRRCPCRPHASPR